MGVFPFEEDPADNYSEHIRSFRVEPFGSKFFLMLVDLFSEGENKKDVLTEVRPVKEYLFSLIPIREADCKAYGTSI